MNNEYEEIQLSAVDTKNHDPETPLEPMDELDELILIREKMENDIRRMWENVIVPQLNNVSGNYILGKLTVNDYHKFYEFMISNNDNFNYVCRRTYFLENKFNKGSN